MATPKYKFVVWERLNKSGKWCPYSAEVSQLLEIHYKKHSSVVALEDADENLKIYSINLEDMVQTSEVSGTKSSVRRCLCDTVNDFCKGFTWQWCDSHNTWHSYDIEVNNFIEEAYLKGKKTVTLNKAFRGYHYEIDFVKMLQINKQTKRKRSIRKQQHTTPYPVTQTSNAESDAIDTTTADDIPLNKYSNLGIEIPGTSALEDQVNAYVRNVHQQLSPSNDIKNEQNGCLDSQNETISAIVNGRPWYDSHPPFTPQAKLKPVPGIEPLPKYVKQKRKKGKASHKKQKKDCNESPVDQFTEQIVVNSSNEEECIICCENLVSGSSYDGDATTVKLKLCPHIFHKSCLLEMYQCSSKENFLQCPTCKTIHGEKCGIQPAGSMIYHVLPYSLPSYSEHDTIRIIYDIPSGIQGEEHPNPGKRYTSRGFPRKCYLPDNEMGRKILRLLIKAWNRRLIFTIGTSSTTGEENTVTWNEIHHKTEFGYNRRGHGYPDINYFSNVLAELEAHGIKDDDIYLWQPV